MAGVSRNGNEQEKLGQSAKIQQKYGTDTKTPYSAAKPDLFVKHFVQKDETLPGIALKYGRSVCWFFRLCYSYKRQTLGLALELDVEYRLYIDFFPKILGTLHYVEMERL